MKIMMITTNMAMTTTQKMIQATLIQKMIRMNWKAMTTDLSRDNGK